MSTSFKNNIGSIIFAVVLAASLWVYVSLKTITTQIVQYPVVVTVQEGKAIATTYPMRVDVKVRTNGWQLFNMQYIGVPPICNVKTESRVPDSSGKILFTKNEILRGLQPNLSLDKIVDLTPEEFKVGLSPLVKKKVPIKHNLSIEFIENYGLTSTVKLRPDSVELSGSYETLSGITEWTTTQLRLHDVFSDFSVVTKPNDSLKPLVECLTKEVQVYASVDELIDLDIIDIPIEIKNAPHKFSEHTILPTKVTVVVRGGVHRLSIIKNSEIHVSLDYKNIQADSTGYLKPIITVPQSIEVISMKPSYIKHKKLLRSSNVISSND